MSAALDVLVLLFAPAHRPERFEKAAQAGADKAESSFTSADEGRGIASGLRCMPGMGFVRERGNSACGAAVSCR